MTKRELIEKLTNYSDDAVICVVASSGDVNDVCMIYGSPSYPDWIKEDEVMIHATNGRVAQCQ